jgi:hypothetical protein
LSITESSHDKITNYSSAFGPNGSISVECTNHMSPVSNETDLPADLLQSICLASRDYLIPCSANKQDFGLILQFHIGKIAQASL